jgi:hypothetical protein
MNLPKVIPNKFNFTITMFQNTDQNTLYTATKDTEGYVVSFLLNGEEYSVKYWQRTVSEHVASGEWTIIAVAAEEAPTSLLSNILSFVADSDRTEVVITASGYDVYLPWHEDGFKLDSAEALEEFMVAARVIQKYL